MATRVRTATQMRASWVPPDNYHITLRFLGDMDPAIIVDLDRLCRDLAEDIEPFECTLDRVGAFPSMDRARVLWVGGEAPSAFQHLCRRLSDGLMELDFPRDKKQSVTHVTLARIKDRPDPRLREIAMSIEPVSPLVLAVDRIVLMESTLTPRGARYAPLFTTKLGAFRT